MVNIGKDEALKLCEEIRKNKAKKLFTQCWGCVKFSHGKVDKMCLRTKDGWDGCKLINRLYEKRK